MLYSFALNGILCVTFGFLLGVHLEQIVKG